MLAEERFAAILELLYERRNISVSDCTQALQISESTIRRDLLALHKMGKLKKVHGGATLLHPKYGTYDGTVEEDKFANQDEIKRIGAYAASFIQKHDFVYLGAGRTTYQMLTHMQEKDATYVTNGLEHATHLAQHGFCVYLLAGELKDVSKGVVGIEAIASLQSYNFTKAFFSIHGICIESGFTTPDIQEAYMKKEIIKRSQKVYILADRSKFGICASITVAPMHKATIITSQGIGQTYHERADILEVIA